MVNVFKYADSDMFFVKDNTFRIDKSPVYESVKSNGVKVVEFIRVKENELIFVEAKKSLHNPEKGEESGKYFRQEIEKIRDKFIHSLNLFSSVKVGIRDEAFADDFVLPTKGALVFILVVKEHKNEDFAVIKTSLNKSLVEAMPPYWLTIWNPVIKVMPHELATKENLTVA